METQQQTSLVKIYPFLAWSLGTVTFLFFLFCAVMATIAKQFGPAIGLLGFSLLGVLIIFLGGVLGVNDHIIVVTTLLTRKQIGWDEVERIEMVQKSSIALYGRAKDGTPKVLMISGPNYWFGKQKTIRKIFARQIKTRQIKVTDAPVGGFRSGSSKSTSVSINADDPEQYIATPPKYTSPAPVFEQSTPRMNISEDAIAPSDFRNSRELELEKKLNRPGLQGNLVLGTAGGAIAMSVGILIWAFIAFVTHYEFSIASIGMGFLVGLTAKILAGKSSTSLGLISGGLSVAGCMLGSVLGVIMIVCHGDLLAAGYIFITFLTHPASLAAAYAKTFSAIDIAFYAVAIVNAYRAAG